MRKILQGIMVSAALLLLASTVAAQGAKPLRKCAPDAVVAGTVCMDKYEASAWRVPDPLGANTGLVKKIQYGKVTVADLVSGGATPLGTAGDDYAPCADSGQNCTDDIYAVSVAGVLPSAFLTWFQAQAACDNARKRLPSNAEWQAAVIGTPDPGPDNGSTDCNSATMAKSLTGARSSCTSARGAFDMVGNLYEWVADWIPRSTGCGTWNASASPTGDDQCLAGAATTGEPAALQRGSNFFGGGASVGPLSVEGGSNPSNSSFTIGFRCAR